jgi:hypothetical protein
LEGYWGSPVAVAAAILSIHPIGGRSSASQRGSIDECLSPEAWAT